MPETSRKNRPRSDEPKLVLAPWSLGLLSGLSVAFSITFLFAVFTWPQFFFFSPFEAANDFSSFLLFLYLITWPMLMVLPPIAAVLRMRKYPIKRIEHSVMFSLGLLLWPITTILIKIENGVRGALSVEYWANYPAFVLFEIVWPLLGLFAWILTSAGYGRNTPDSPPDQASLDDEDLRKFVGIQT